MQENPENKIFDAAGTEPDAPITGGPDCDPFAEANTDFDAAAQPEPTQPEPDQSDSPGFMPRYDREDVAGQSQTQYDGDNAADAQKEWKQRNEASMNALNDKFSADNKKLKIILFSVLGVIAVTIVAIIALLIFGGKPAQQPVDPPPPPEPEIQIVKPDAVGVKKSNGELELADPGELNIALSTPMYEPEQPGLMSYYADIPCAVQLYHDLGTFQDLNKFQATASTYAALVRSKLMEPLELFHDIRYTDYQDQNHPEPEYIGTNYAILSGTDFYQTHNYELLMDSDGCQSVTYSYTFNLKNSSRIEEYDFNDYLDCLRVLTGFDLTNNDVLYLIRVSMNNYNQNGQSTVQAISNDDPRDYILFEQSPGAEPGSYNFIITCRKNMNVINAPSFDK